MKITKKPTLTINHSIKNESGSRVGQLEIRGIIGVDFEADFEGESMFRNTRGVIREKIVELFKNGAESLSVNICAEYGEADTAMEIFELLAGQSVPVETYMHGFCGSAAVIIAQAGKTRKASENAVFGITGDYRFTFGMVNQNTVKEKIQEIKENDRIAAKFFSQHSRHTTSHFLSLMQKNTDVARWVDASEFIDTGLIDNIVKPKDGEQSAVDALNFKKQTITNRNNKKADREAHARELELAKLKSR